MKFLKLNFTIQISDVKRRIAEIRFPFYTRYPWKIGTSGTFQL